MESSKINPIKTYPVDTTTYWVSLVSTFTYKDVTCTDSVSKLRKIGPDVTVFVPNVFSPEETGPDSNNVFRAVVNGERTFNIEVLNRWGELLWESDDKFETWNGKYKGVNCEQDVYVWIVRVTGYDGEPYRYEGTVTLLR